MTHFVINSLIFFFFFTYFTSSCGFWRPKLLLINYVILIINLNLSHSFWTQLNKYICIIFFFLLFFRAASCQNAIELYDGVYASGAKPIRKICSPISKRARDSSTGRFVEQQSFVSTENSFSIKFKRSFPSHKQEEIEFLDGAYLFHDGNDHQKSLNIKKKK